MERLIEILREHKGKEHIRGTRDCNLMFFQLYEPEMYTALHLEYTDIIDGVKAGKRLFGFKSLRDFLKKHKSYNQITHNYQKLGDIIIHHKAHDVYISTGTKWFGVKADNTFGLVARYKYNSDDYKIFRRSE